MTLSNSSRRHLMQWAGRLGSLGGAALLLPYRSFAQSGGDVKSTRLVAYYSRTGHTRQAALAIAQMVDADVFEIKPATPYPAAYQATVDLNRRQGALGEFPEPAELVPGLARYEIVFIGYPIWAVDLPRLLYPFLRQQDFSGKTLAPFCTSAMSGIGETGRVLRQLCPRTRMLAGLSLPGGPRGHNTLVTSISADARRRAEQWGRETLSRKARA